MISLTAQQPFSSILFKRRIETHPRLYLKDQPTYRYSRMFLTRIGFASLLLLTSFGVGLLISFNMLLK